MEQIEGEIQFMKKDRKSFTINSDWYNNKFKIIPDEFNKGDYVKVGFIQKDNKNFWQSIEKIKQDIPEETKDLPVLPKYISDSTINCLLMQSVQHAENSGQSLKLATSEVLNSYNSIIEFIVKSK